jgi:RND family efflux transporter MFP subunit
MKKHLILLFAVLGTFSVLWWFIGDFRPEVLTAEAVRGTAVNAVTGTVKVFANMDIQLKNEQQGVLSELKVKMGDKVVTDTVIAQFKSEDIELKLNEKRIQLESARKRLQIPYPQLQDVENTEAELMRIKQLMEAGMSSQSEVDKIERELSKRKAWLSAEQIQRAEQAALYEIQIQMYERELSKMQVRAPWEGEVAEILAWPGQFLWSNNAVARLISSGRWIQLTLAEEDFYGVEKGQKATLYLAAYPNQSIEAVVTDMARFSDSEKKTRNVFLQSQASDERLVPGFSGEGVLIKEERLDAVIIPRRALIGDKVYVVTEGRVDIRSVKVGFLGLNKAEILEGIAVGDQIVLEDQTRLTHGAAVKVIHSR